MKTTKPYRPASIPLLDKEFDADDLWIIAQMQPNHGETLFD